MDFDISALDAMNDSQNQGTVSMAMRNLIATGNQGTAEASSAFLWPSQQDVTNIPLQDLIDMHSNTSNTTNNSNNTSNDNMRSSHQTQAEPLQSSDTHHEMSRYHHAILPQKRGHSDVEAVLEQTHCNVGNVSNVDSVNTDAKPNVASVSSDGTEDHLHGSTSTSALPSAASPLVIDTQVVFQMGGLPYAELCKERAREQYKEAKKSEYLASGNFDRMKRRKKNDTSMTPRQKYIRRLRMNQDSAAAARHAQDVYVRVLEKLVKTSEEERRSFAMEMHQVRAQKDHLHRKVMELQQRADELEQERGNNLLVVDDLKRHDPSLAKFMDMFKMAPTIGVQADMGVQPARAV